MIDDRPAGPHEPGLRPHDAGDEVRSANGAAPEPLPASPGEPVERPGGTGRPWLWIALILAVLVAIIAYGALVFTMAGKQNDLVFEPTRTEASPGEAGVFAAEARITTNDGLAINAWYRAPAGDAPLIFFLHGNRGALPDYADRINAYLSVGFGVLAIDYRGYGASTGEATLDGIVVDAEAAYDFLLERGVAADRIVLHGFSLGSIPATSLAASKDVAGLILEAPFEDLATMAAHRYPYLIAPLVRPLLPAVDPGRAMAAVTEPVLVLHGTDDEIVPIAFGRSLLAAAQNGRAMVAVEGGTHSSLLADGAYEDAFAFAREVVGAS